LSNREINGTQIAYSGPTPSTDEIQRLETEIAQRLRVAKRKAEGDMLMHYTKVGFVSEVVLGPPMQSEVTFEEYKSRPLRALFVQLKLIAPGPQRMDIDTCLAIIEEMTRRSQTEGRVDREYLNLIAANLDQMLKQRAWPQ